MDDKLQLVNYDDNVIGYGEKIETHKLGLLHRAFSLFLINSDNNKILLQKRAVNKYHSGGLWSNSCCSHQYKDEKWISALKRCLLDELNLELNITRCLTYSDTTMVKEAILEKNPMKLNSFLYFSDYGEIKEHEVDHVFVLYIDNQDVRKIRPNVNEVDEIRWLSVYEIESMLNQDISIFTSWFLDAYTIVKKAIY